MYDVRVSSELAKEIATRFPAAGDDDGSPTEWAFWEGPLRAAQLAFRRFDRLPYTYHQSVRRYWVPDPVFGPLVFIGVEVAADTVDLVAFDVDEQYWFVITDQPS